VLPSNFWFRINLLVAACAVSVLHAESDAVVVAAAGNTRPGASPTGTITPPPVLACISGIGLSASSVIGGSDVNGTVMLTGPASSGGVNITLTSSSTSAEVTTNITAPPGASSANFSISTSPVTSATNAVITTSAAGCLVNANASVNIQPAVLVGLTLSANSARGNSSLNGTVTLNGPGPSGGAVITLHSSDLLVSTPASVTIPAGQTSASFTVNAGLSLSQNSVAITARYGGTIQTALLSILPGI